MSDRSPPRRRMVHAAGGAALLVLGLMACTPDDAPSEAIAPVLDASDVGDSDMQAGMDAQVADAGDPAIDMGSIADRGVDAQVDQGRMDAEPAPIECLEPGPMDALCDPQTNCCADGLVCADFGGGGRCVQACDARVADCGHQALCVPLSLPGGDRPLPGACLRSARCDVDAGPACGPNSTCTILSNISLCTRAGDARPGEACTVFAENPVLCAAETSCVLGTCQAACGRRGDCADGARCVDYAARLGGDAFRFCYAGCDVFAQQGCGPDATCVVADVAPTAGTDRREILGACVDRPQGVGTQSQACTPAPGTDWGDCKGGHLCQRPAAGAAPICVGVCDDVDRSLCAHGSLCVLDVFDVPMGLCVGECVVWPGPEDKRCAADEICAYKHIGLDQAGAAVPGGRCEPRLNAPAAGALPGEICQLDAATGHHDCATGALCTALDPQSPPVCVPLCTLAEGGDRPCPVDQGCVDVFDDGRIGVCLEGFAK